MLRLFFVYDTNFLYDQQNWASPPFLGLPFHQTSINVIMTSTTDTDILRVILPTIAEYIHLSDTLFATLDSVSGRAPKRFRYSVDWSKFVHDMINDSTFTVNTRHAYAPSDVEELLQIGETMKE